MLVVGAALLGHPRQVAGAVPLVNAVAVETGVGAADWPVAAHDVAVGMGGRVRTDHAIPALAIAAL